MSLVRDRVQAQVGAQLQAAQPLLLHYATCDIHVEPGVEALVDGLLGSCGEMMKLAGDATSYGALWGNRQCGKDGARGHRGPEGSQAAVVAGPACAGPAPAGHRLRPGGAGGGPTCRRGSTPRCSSIILCVNKHTAPVPQA